MKALIDGDVIRYSIGAACQKKVTDDYGIEHLVAEPDYIWKHTVDKMISSILVNTKSDSCKIYLTGKGNFREEIAKKKGYKENRKDLQKPLLYNEISTHLVDDWCAEVITGMEADDQMAITQIEYAKKYGVRMPIGGGKYTLLDYEDWQRIGHI